MPLFYTILAGKKLSKYPTFYDICPKKLTKFPNFTRFLPRILHNNCPKNIFPAPSPMPVYLLTYLLKISWKRMM